MNQPGNKTRLIAMLFLAASLTIAPGCARTDWIDRTLVTVDVTGTWSGTMVGAGRGATGSGGDISLELTQQGPQVTGYIRAAAYMVLSGPIEGTVAGDVFTFRRTNGGFSAEVTVDGDEMNGTTSGSATQRISLRRGDPSSPPRSRP